MLIPKKNSQTRIEFLISVTLLLFITNASWGQKCLNSIDASTDLHSDYVTLSGKAKSKHMMGINAIVSSEVKVVKKSSEYRLVVRCLFGATKNILASHDSDLIIYHSGGSIRLFGKYQEKKFSFKGIKRQVEYFYDLTTEQIDEIRAANIDFIQIKSVTSGDFLDLKKDVELQNLTESLQCLSGN